MARVRPRPSQTPAPLSAPTPTVPAPAVTPGLPRWFVIVCMLIPAAALVWEVAAHFIPRAAPARRDATAVAPATGAQATTPTVIVTGSGNVGVGVQHGGTIISATTVPATAAASATRP